jgi:hypothetical protein
VISAFTSEKIVSSRESVQRTIRPLFDPYPTAFWHDRAWLARICEKRSLCASSALVRDYSEPGRFAQGAATCRVRSSEILSEFCTWGSI